MQNNEMVSATTNEQKVTCWKQQKEILLSDATRVVVETRNVGYDVYPRFEYVETSYIEFNWDVVVGYDKKGKQIIFRSESIANALGYRSDRDGNGYYQTLNDGEVRRYHHFSRRDVSELLKNEKLNNTHYRVGIEVEKEDYFAKLSSKADTIYDKYKWAKEEDGSLCLVKGYEFISPTYSLYGKKLKSDLKKAPIKKLIDGNYSDRCGGHINLSSAKYNSKELYQGLSAFFPLFYSIYENRIHADFCQAKKVSEMAWNVQKRSAFYMKNDAILEIRLFPAVKNTNNLLWRLDLIKICVENINCSEMDVLRMLTSKKSKLYKHLLKVIDEQKIQQKVIKFIKYSREFNDKNLNN